MLVKILIFALIAAVIYFMLKSKLLGKKSKKNDEIEALEGCKKCGTFVSSDELKDGLCQECQQIKG
ncbi:hypothetical protein [Campylobacter sp.]|uniref:hypothetical protein n=1 Tax=Campylobacter sp. TaxID=205 RepID=UPI002A96DFB6|nr:hypothetical protein [Campylobacter sp.]MCI6660814.1 hypothetical protein [Campylobacter sp.]MDY5304817.1 hypothetical protein [Campylobacter sp.]